MIELSNQHVATAPFGKAKRGQFQAAVILNRPLCRDHFLLTLRIGDFPPSEPGQFVQVLCPPPDTLGTSAPVTESLWHESSWEPGAAPPRFQEPYLLAAEPYLRRPFSIAGRRDDAASGHAEIDLIYRVIGKATGRMQTLRPGDSISILGPLGNAFPVPTSGTSAYLVGGGVGIPPMIYLAEKLNRLGVNAVAFIGAQRADLIPLEITGSVGTEPTANVLEFSRSHTPAVVATDDGSLGYKGFVTQALEAYGRQNATESAVVFCCGPTPMMRATAEVAERLKRPCYASLEQPMACGMGTCQSCVIKYRPPGITDWIYKLTCTDGPVFQTTDILW
jgi:dihydroorotate dehydrogenase electron transfer subunit